ncbi:hypothetical protein NECAME_18086 [Necator americanus]|uniref:Uncharacterized protein n=1 Tax=Necator americanus TaxID=51031 RepID=W2TF35_NECAM|nr:hypothetical protein NECAME_18086 [Necator americanus]ETN79637.1 hypothetical protein NECAME_18086 [Necator americanus]
MSLQVSEDGTGEGESNSNYLPAVAQTEAHRAIEFIADHPFIFVLSKDFNPLFIGHRRQYSAGYASMKPIEVTK